jgi:cell division protein FtsB
LKEEINRLQDPEYMAKYAREKYLYSKNGEIIIKIED